MRLLVVDDDAKLRRLLVGLFTAARYTVEAVGTAEAARAALAVAPYDLVVLELTLPDGDGEALVRHIRARGLDMTLLVNTGVSDLDRRIAALEAGADDCMVKPVPAGVLLARVRALLRRRPGGLGGRRQTVSAGVG